MGSAGGRARETESDLNDVAQSISGLLAENMSRAREGGKKKGGSETLRDGKSSVLPSVPAGPGPPPPALVVSSPQESAGLGA